MKIAFLIPPFSGHLYPIGNIAICLKNRGHEVFLLSTIDVENKVHGLGINFVPIAIKELPKGETDRLIAWIGEKGGVQSSIRLVKLYQKFVQGILREVPSVFEQLSLDGFVCDQTITAAYTLKELTGVPFISACGALHFSGDTKQPSVGSSVGFEQKQNSILWKSVDFLNQLKFQWIFIPKCIQPVISYRKKAGMKVYKKFDPQYYFDSDLAIIAQQSESLNYPSTAPSPITHFCGSLSNYPPIENKELDFGFTQKNPIIFVSLGTLQTGMTHIFDQIIAACEGFGNLVITYGGRQPPSNLPGWVKAFKYLPQREVLQKVDLFISHAGLNGTLEALASGVPIVAIPIANDQFEIAARIAYSGAGQFISHKHLNRKSLTNLVQEVLDNPSYKLNAIRISKELDAAGGPERAASIIEDIFLPAFSGVTPEPSLISKY